MKLEKSIQRIWKHIQVMHDEQREAIRPSRHHLDEVAPDVVVVGSGDRLSVLRDDLQGLQHFALRPAQVRAARAHTHR